MRISSDELVKLVPRSAPEGLINHAICRGLLETATLVYNFEWDRQAGLSAALEARPLRKVKVVRAVCSECGQAMYFQYAPPGSTNRTYGFITGYEYCEGGELIGDGDHTICPQCGARCIARLASKIGRGRYASDEALVMSAGTIDVLDSKGKKPLVLTMWRVVRECDRFGHDYYRAEPWDAYVFDGADAQKLTGHVLAYSGNAGYFQTVKHNWGAPQRWHATHSDACIAAIFGLNSDMLEETSVANSKLAEYFTIDSIHQRGYYPVVYMRLWQKYPQVENLVMNGAAHIIDGLINVHLSRHLDWEETNRKGELALPELDLNERRPAQMLRLDKDEFRLMQRQAWSFYYWDVFVNAKRKGDRLTADDITRLHEYGGDDIKRLIGLAPLGKCLRYLLRQKHKCGDENAYTDPEGVIFDTKISTAVELADYWRMAETLEWDVKDPAVRWPKDLMRAHERAAEAYNTRKERIQAKKFARVYKELRRYTYFSAGLVIRPAKTLNELKEEGRALHHCVGTYGKEHISGKPIFFIRRVAEPRKPWYTLQLDMNDKSVLQNRGKYNCSRTPEVRAFEKEWIDWVLRGAPQQTKNDKKEKIA